MKKENNEIDINENNDFKSLVLELHEIKSQNRAILLYCQSILIALGISDKRLNDIHKKNVEQALSLKEE